MPDALIVDNEPFLASKAADIAAAGMPAISGGREFAVAPARRLRRQHLRGPSPDRKLYQPHPEGELSLLIFRLSSRPHSNSSSTSRPSDARRQSMTAIVKGFRMPAGRGREGMHG